MEPLSSTPAPDHRLFLCTLILVFAIGHIIIGMIRGARSWRAVVLILLGMGILFLALALPGQFASAAVN